MTDSIRTIYEDDALHVVSHSGDSDYMLVTFGDLVSLATETRFFADTPAIKLSINCIGFMAKQPNWFPKRNMEAAISALNPLLSRHSRRLVYGGSMGGYGAVKYSGLLGATAVIAMCPQWSLDIGECKGKNPGWQSYYTNEMEGMGIKPGDLMGRIYILADLHDALDLFHAEHILICDPECRLIDTPYLGHSVTSALAGTANLAKLIAAAFVDDVATMRRLGRAARIDSERRTANVLAHALRKKPALAYRFLSSRTSDPSSRYASIIADHAMGLAGWMAQQGMVAEAVDLLVTTARAADNFTRYVMLHIFAAGIVGKPLRIVDDRGRHVRFDFDSGSCKTSVSDGMVGRIAMQISGSSVRLVLEEGGFQLGMHAGSNGKLGPDTDLQDGAEADVELHSGKLCFRFSTGYLSSEPNGTLIANRQRVGDWEKFALQI